MIEEEEEEFDDEADPVQLAAMQNEQPHAIDQAINEPAESHNQLLCQAKRQSSNEPIRLEAEDAVVDVEA